MIHANRIVTVGEQECIIDRPIVLYRGDREVEIEFTLVGNEFMFSEEGNVIKSVNASHGQLVLNTPSGEHMFSELAECHEGKVVFIVTKEMIDEFIEMGFYSFQIRLYDSAEMKSRVTIPPVMNGFDIRNPIAAEDETNVVDQGIVDYARIFKDQSNEELPTFDWHGNYNKTEWAHHDLITENKMNKIEDALYSINANVKESDVVMLNALDNVKKDADAYVKEHMAEVEADVDEFERNLNIDVQQFKIDTNAAMTAHKNEVSEELEGFSTQLADNITMINKLTCDLESLNINVMYTPNHLQACKCDLVTDDTKALQDIIDYVSNSGGGVVYIPNSILLSNIIVREGVTLKMPAMASKYASDLKQTKYIKRKDGASGVLLTFNSYSKALNITIDGNKSKSSGSGILFNPHSEGENIHVSHCEEHGIIHKLGVRLSNFHSSYNKQRGVHSLGSDSLLSNFYIYGNSSEGLYIDTGVSNCGYLNGKIEWNYLNISSYIASENYLNNINIDRSTGFGIKVIGGSIYLSNCRIWRNYKSTTIPKEGASHILLEGNPLVFMSNVGIMKGGDDGEVGTISPDYVFTGWNTSKAYVKLSNCNLKNCSNESLLSSYAGASINIEKTNCIE